MPDLRHPDCWDPPTIYHHLAPFPNAGNGTKANSCQQFVVMFNKDASGVSALQHFRKIELKATFRPLGMPDQPHAICVACDLFHTNFARDLGSLRHLGRGTGSFFAAFRSGTLLRAGVG